MDINIFNDPNQIPQAPEKIRIESLSAIPYPDRLRIRIDIRVTMFQQRPNLILAALDQDGKVISELNIIATMHADMEFTMHLRGVSDPTGDYTLSAELFYETRNPPQDQRTISFSVPPATG